MNTPSLRGNALCLAVAAALVGTLPAAAADTVIIRDAELEYIRPVTNGHAEVYDSRVTNHQVGGGSAVSIDRGNLRMERTQVLTTGDGMAALSYYGGQYTNTDRTYDATIEGASFTTRGDRAFGLQFASLTFNSSTGELHKVGTITVRDSSVQTHGTGSIGMTVAGVNAVDAFNTRIATEGQGALGVAMMGGRLDLRGSDLDTSGDAAHGIHARAMRWSVGGMPAVTYRAELALRDTTLHVQGKDSVGILAGYQDLGSQAGIGAQLRLENTHVRSARGHAVQFLRGEENTLALEAGSVLDAGDAVVYAAENGSVNVVDARDATLIGRGAQALVADQGARLLVQLHDSQVRVDPGRGLAHARNGARIALDAHGSQLQGSVQADAGAYLGMHLDRSVWDAWGTSQLDQLSLRNRSVLQLGAGSVGDRVTVRGDLHVDDSTLMFDSALGADGSATDQLWVQGDTTGRGEVVVNNVGGRGAQTVAGIRLIQVDGTSGASLQLSGRAVGGQYEYFLHQGSIDDPADGDWYLRSTLQPTVDPCSADPAAPGCTVAPVPESCQVDPHQAHCRPDPVTTPEPVPVLRPEPGAYLANQQAALQLFHRIAYDPRGRATGGQGAWAAVSGSQSRYAAGAGQLHVRGDNSALQVGIDVLDWGRTGHGQVGVMLGSGRASATSMSRQSGYSASGSVEGHAAGLYAQWGQRRDEDAGLRVGATLQHARFRNTVSGQALRAERYRSRNTTATVDAAYAFTLVDSGRRTVYVQPQLAITARRFDADAHVETNGTRVADADAGRLGGRVGLRVFGQGVTAGNHRVQPSLAVNWIAERGDNALQFDGERMAAGLPRQRIEIKAGMHLQLGARWSAWGDMATQNGSGGYREVAGQIGLRRRW